MIPHGPPMTLGNMRELGVHHLIGYCAGPCLPIRIPATSGWVDTTRLAWCACSRDARS